MTTVYDLVDHYPAGLGAHGPAPGARRAPRSDPRRLSRWRAAKPRRPLDLTPLVERDLPDGRLAGRARARRSQAAPR